MTPGRIPASLRTPVRVLAGASIGAYLGMLCVIVQGDSGELVNRLRDPLFWWVGLTLWPAFAAIWAVFRGGTLALLVLAVGGGIALGRYRPRLAPFFVALVMGIISYLVMDAWIIRGN